MKFCKGFEIVKQKLKNGFELEGWVEHYVNGQTIPLLWPLLPLVGRAQFGQFASLLFFTIISSHYIHETVAAVIMRASYQRNGAGSNPPNPQFHRRVGAKVWSILLLDTFLNFQPAKPTLDFVDSAGWPQAGCCPHKRVVAVVATLIIRIWEDFKV